MIKKLWTLISAGHALMLAYRAEIYLWVMASTLPFLMMSIWMTAAGSGGGSGGVGSRFSMTPVEYARYFLAVFLVRQLTIVWMIYEFEWHVNEGRLTYLLLRPINTIWHFVSMHLAEQMARGPFFVLIIVLFFCLYPSALWAPHPLSLIVGFGAIYAAFALRFSIGYCLSMLTFRLERASSLEQLNMVPYLFLSGIIIPLADFPAGVRRYIELLPFPYMVDFPARILTGKLGVGDPEILQGFGVEAVWFLLFCGIGAVMWKRGLHHYSGNGA